MKKQLLLLLLILFLNNTYGQNYAPDQLLSYQKIESVDGVTAAELMKLARAWAMKYYTNYQSVVQEETSEKLVLNGNYKMAREVKGYPVSVPIAYQLTIEARDNRYRATIENMARVNDAQNISTPVTNRETAMQLIDSYQFSQKIRKEAIGNMEEEFTLLETHFQGLFTDLKKVVLAQKKDDW